MSVVGERPATPPRVTVVVLNYCNEDEAADCVASLQASNYAALDILLVDNASPDGSGERLRARLPDIHHLAVTTNGGYTAGNNRGFEWALAHGADYVLVLNDDTVIDPDCIGCLVRAAEETGAAVTAPLILYHAEPNIVWYGGGVLSRTRVMCTHIGENQPIDPTQSRAPVSFVCGCCFLYRAGVLRSVGGFDERFFSYVEDLELSLRLSRGGHTLLYEPAARVFHRIGRAQLTSPMKVRLRDMNRRRVAARHYGLVEWLRFASWFYPTRLIHLARYTATGQWAHARAELAGTFASLDGPSMPNTQLGQISRRGA